MAHNLSHQISHPGESTFGFVQWGPVWKEHGIKCWLSPVRMGNLCCCPSLSSWTLLCITLQASEKVICKKKEPYSTPDG